VPPKHEANVPVRMSDDGTPHPSSNLAIKPHILEMGVMAARSLFSNSHKEPVAHVCNYSKKPYTYKADSFLGLAKLVVHITGVDSKALRPSLTGSGLNVLIQPDLVQVARPRHNLTRKNVFFACREAVLHHVSLLWCMARKSTGSICWDDP